MEKNPYSINQSINHSPNLFDAPGTEAFALKQVWLIGSTALT